MDGTTQGRKPDHIPVLLDEVLKNLVGSKSGTYVDATFGRGGHSAALLDVLAMDSRVVGFDRDPQAVEAGVHLAAQEARLSINHAAFSELATHLRRLNIEQVDGVLMDLGVSSPQLDDATRGFSFRAEGPLDMRMDPTRGESAAQWLNHAEESEIAAVIKSYGEERFARRIARAIIAARPLASTVQLADAVADVVPMRGRQNKHPATKTFQAVRMFVNQEMVELEQGLRAAFEALAPQGRLAVISFHSLEDRAVKHYFRTLTRPPVLPRRLPVRQAQLATAARDIAGPLRASIREIEANPRARSATLRVIQKNAGPEAGN